MKKDNNDFILLITGSENNDSAVRMIAPPEKELICHKMQYVPPYENYSEIKKLQKRLANSSYVKGMPVSCSMDLSEWTGHEKEEYFELMLKYLHDHRSCIFVIFTVGESSEEQVRPMYFKLRCFLRGSIVSDLTFISETALCRYFEGRQISHDAAQILSELVMRDEMSELRSYPVTDIICEEIRSSDLPGGSFSIGAADVIHYLKNTDALPSILNSQVTLNIVSKYEKTISENTAA